jgi:large subunit ribosomal protein L19e
MELRKAKELAAKILKVGVGKIHINPEQEKKVKEAMTKDDIRGLIAERIIRKRRDNQQSKGRTRDQKEQKRKGRRRGQGKRKGTKKTRIEKKKTWMSKVRAQRRTLKELKTENPEKIKEIGYSNLYRKIKGGFFKGKKYLKEYVEGEKK